MEIGKYSKILNGIKADVENSKLILNLPEYSAEELLGHEAINVIHLKDTLQALDPESGKGFADNIEEYILDQLDEDYFIALLQKTTEPHGAAAAFLYWYVVQLIAREINKRIYREVYQHFLKTPLYKKTVSKGNYMLIQLLEWANHAVIDACIRLVGIEPGADLEQVYTDAQDYALNFSLNNLVDIAGREQKERSDVVINLLAALAYRSLAAGNVLQQETQLGQATFTMQKNSGRTATQADLNEHVTQVVNVAKGIYKHRKLPAQSYQNQIINKVKLSLWHPENYRLQETQNDLSVEFWSRINETKRLIESQNWNAITLPIIKLESPHPEWEKFIVEKTREAIKKYAAENYDLYKDWPELKRCCINAIDGMAGKMSGEQATHERKIEIVQPFEDESLANSLQDKAPKSKKKTEATNGRTYAEILPDDNLPDMDETIEKDIKWRAINKAISKLYNDEKSRLIIELLKLKADDKGYTEEQLTKKIKGHPEWPGMPISTQKHYIKQISKMFQYEES